MLQSTWSRAWSVVTRFSSHGLRRMLGSNSKLFSTNDTILNKVASGPDQTRNHSYNNILQSGLRILNQEENMDSLKRNIQNRGMDMDVDKLASLYRDYKNIRHQIKKTRQLRNTNAKMTATAQPESKNELISKGRQIKEEIVTLERELFNKEQLLYPLLVQLPNHTHPDAPIGDETAARVVCVHGDKPKFDFPVSDHVEIGERLGLIDFKAAASASGRCFYYLKGVAAQLELALIQYTMNKAISKGFQPVITPDIVGSDIVEGCGFQPKGESTHVYMLDPRYHGDKCLTGTAEIPLTGMFANQLIPVKDLPIRLVAFGRCFRAEAGHGKVNKGLYRVHQFSKVEMFAVTANQSGEESEQLLKEMIEIQKEINSELGFHYRVLEMATGDLGIPAYHKFDIEVWMPGMAMYGEVTSASNCTDFQSRRVNIKCAGIKKNPHTVNGTACATPRTILALLENNQNEDGTVSLPAVLQPYICKTIIE